MPRLDPLAVSQSFTNQIADPRAQTQNMLQQAQLAEKMYDVKDRNALRDAMLNAEDPDQAAKLYLQSGGNPGNALKLEDRANAARDREEAATDRGRKRQIDDIKVAESFKEVLQGTENLTPQTWGAWRKSLQRYADFLGEDISDIPMEYDEKAVAEARERLKPAIEKIGGYEFFRQGNDYRQVTPRQPKESWQLVPPEAAAAAGLPDGAVYQQSSQGKVQSVYEPNGGKSPAKIQLMDELLARGIATDDRDAWAKANQAVQNPASAAGQLARSQFESQAENFVRPGNPAYRTLDEFYTEWYQRISSFAAGDMPSGRGGPPEGAPTATNPQTGEKIYYNGTQWVPYQ